MPDLRIQYDHKQVMTLIKEDVERKLKEDWVKIDVTLKAENSFGTESFLSAIVTVVY